jgi:aspartate aminotransferase
MTALSRRVRNIGPSATLEISETVAKLRAAGTHVHDLGLGEADLDAPAPACDALARIARTRRSRYTEVAGAIELRRAITRSLNRSFFDQTSGDTYMPGYGPDEIIVGAGSKHLQYSAVQALCNPGDEVILLAPYWVSYPDMVRMADATPVVVDSGPDDGFVPSIDDIAAAITPRSRLVFLNTPGNPAGQVWTRRQVGELCDLVLAHENLILVSDEIYSGLVFGDARHVSPVTHSERMRRRTILTAGLSKTHAMGGWRIGYAAVADGEILRGMKAVAACTVSCAPSLIQDSAVHAIEDRAHVCAMRIEFERRARHFGERLGAMGLPALPTRGAFYAFADVRALFGAEVQGRPLESSHDVAMALLDDARVASVPGECFGAPGFVRFSFVRPLEALDAACDAIEAFVLRYRRVSPEPGPAPEVAGTARVAPAVVPSPQPA